MKNRMKFNIAINKLFINFSEYFLLILIIIDCNTVYRHILGKPIVPQIWNYILLITCIIIILKDKKQIKKYSYNIFRVILYNSLVMALIFIPQYDIILYTRLFLLFFPLSIILILQDINSDNKFNMFFKFENIVLILAISSISFWILGSLLSFIKPNISIPVTWNNGDLYSGIYGLCFQYKPQNEIIPFLNIKVLRNIGIFTESLMFDIILLIGLYTELFLKIRSKIFKLIILSLTILSTFGTLGIILMLFGYLLKLILYFENIKQYKKICTFLLIMILFVIGCLLFNKKVNGFGSFSTHLDDYIAGIKAWKTSPLIGTGFNNYDIIRKYMNPIRGNNLGTSNSLTDVLAQGGIFMLVIYLYPFYSAILSYKKDKKFFLWSLAPFTLFIVTIYHLTFLIFFIHAFCLAYSWSLRENYS